MSRYSRRDRRFKTSEIKTSEIKTPENVSRVSTKERVEMFFCLIPVFGLIPSAIALVRQRSSRQVRDVSQVAIALMLTWAIAYGTMGGVPTDGATLQVSGELLKGSFTSGYFALCLYLMYRLYRHQAIALPWLADITESKETRSTKRDRGSGN